MTDQAIARASAWMASARSSPGSPGRCGPLPAGVVGKSLNADLFDIANTIPNSLYILVAGGVFNVVLVPQLVRAMKNDADGGERTPTGSSPSAYWCSASARRCSSRSCRPAARRLQLDLFAPGFGHQRTRRAC